MASVLNRNTNSGFILTPKYVMCACSDVWMPLVNHNSRTLYSVYTCSVARHCIMWFVALMGCRSLKPFLMHFGLHPLGDSPYFTMWGVRLVKRLPVSFLNSPFMDAQVNRKCAQMHLFLAACHLPIKTSLWSSVLASGGKTQIVHL